MSGYVGISSDVRTPGSATGVMVVDDHAILRTGVCRLIEAEPGFRLLGEADCPADALELAGRWSPALAVVDLTYPDGGTGFDLIRDLPARCPGCRVIAYSAADGPGCVERCLRAGAAAFVSKAEEAGRLLEALRAVRDGRGYVSEDRAGDLLARMARQPADPCRPAVETLSPCEAEVFRLIGRGLSTRQIAEQLRRKVKTVETYLARIRRKLGVTGAARLAQLAAAEAVPPPPPPAPADPHAVTEADAAADAAVAGLLTPPELSLRRELRTLVERSAALVERSRAVNGRRPFLPPGTGTPSLPPPTAPLADEGV